MMMIDSLLRVKCAGENNHESHPLLQRSKGSPSGDKDYEESGKTQSHREKITNENFLSSQRGGCGLMKAALPKQEAKR